MIYWPSRSSQPVIMPRQKDSLRNQPGRPAPKPAPPVRSRRPVFDVQAMRSAVTPQQISTEETKVRQVEESIRVFVRVADPKFRQVVPMRFFNLTLSPAEADACSADYLEEKSQRGNVARVLLRIVAVVARISTEHQDQRSLADQEALYRRWLDERVGSPYHLEMIAGRGSGHTGSRNNARP